MLRSELRKLARKMFVLALLIGALVSLTLPRSAYAYGEAEACDAAYASCSSFCNGSSVCEFFCWYDWNNCSREVQPEGPPQS
jgi:hypothetical protein